MQEHVLRRSLFLFSNDLLLTRGKASILKSKKPIFSSELPLFQISELINHIAGVGVGYSNLEMF